MRIMYSNQWDLYSLTESQEDASYPVENTQDTRLVKTWRTTTASAATIVIDAGTGLTITCDCCSILEHNFSSSKSWTERAAAANNNWYSVCWSPGLTLFCAVSGATSAEVMTSPDGITWTQRVGTAGTWAGITWASALTLFCAVNAGTPGIMVSSTGTIWSAASASTAHNWTSVCWSPGLSLLCALSNSGTTTSIMTSPDASTWTGRTSPNQNAWSSVCWSSALTLLCAVSYSGTTQAVITSSDGITWTARTTPNNAWRSVCWSPELKLFCAVASDGYHNRVITSSDGITWTAQVTPIDNSWQSIDWSPEFNQFVAVSSTGTNDRVMVSSDGINWATRTSAVDEDWYSVCWSPDLLMFAAVSYSTGTSQVMTSYRPEIKIQAHASDSWGTPSLDSVVTYRSDTMVLYFISSTFRFWRFSFSDLSNSDTYYEAGRLFLGDYIQVDPSSLVEFPQKQVRNDRQMWSKSGQLYADQGSGWKELHYKFPRSTNSMKGSVETMWGSCGKFKPILVMNYDTTFTVIDPLYCTVTEDITFKHLKHDKWEYDLHLRECN